MRSSKSRSRSKSNRNRPSGNNVNRVFDSSGPEGKVRGTPQQIIDKYNQLARDAQLANDRVAFENFQQHAEHYTRLLGEAQREMDARREQQERERERQQQNQQQNQQRRDDQGDRGGDAKAAQPAPEATEGGDVIDTRDGAGDTLVVDTPENAEPKPRRQRRKRQDKDSPSSGADDAASESSEAAE
jgi:hypothetical protein